MTEGSSKGKLKGILWIVLAPLLAIISWLLLARIVRHLYEFPMPHFLANFIDNPGRRKFQPPDGSLAISELLSDPDYKRPATLRREVEAAGFRFKRKEGNFLVYSMLFGKVTMAHK